MFMIGIRINFLGLRPKNSHTVTNKPYVSDFWKTTADPARGEGDNRPVLR